MSKLPHDATEDAVLTLAMNIASRLVHARNLADAGHVTEAAAAVEQTERLCAQIDGHLNRYRRSLERLARELASPEAATPF